MELTCLNNERFFASCGGQILPIRAVKTPFFPGEMAFSWPRKRVTMDACQHHDNSATCTGSPDSRHGPPSMASLATRGPSFSRSSDVKKNALRLLRASVANLLRSTTTASPRSFLRRSTCLSRLLHSPRPVSLVPRREDRTSRLAGRQSFLHQALRLLRGRRCRSSTIKDVAKDLHLDWHTVKELGQAVHGRAAAPGRSAEAQSHRHRRNLDRPRATATASWSATWRRGRPIWFGGIDRSEASMDAVLCLAWPQPKSSKIRLAVMDMWKAFRNSTLNKSRCRQAPLSTTSFMCCAISGWPWTRSARANTPGSPGQDADSSRAKSTPCCRDWRNLTFSGRKALEAAGQRQQASQHRLRSEGILRTTCGATSNRDGLGVSSTTGGPL